MAQVRALMRELVLEELLAGEVLEIGVVDPALAHLFVGQGEDMLEQHQSDHEARRYPGPALVAVERSDLFVEMLPIEPARKLHQLVLHVDDLVEPSPEQVTFRRHQWLLWPHRIPRCSTESLFASKGNPKMKLQDSRPSSLKTLQSQNHP